MPYPAIPQRWHTTHSAFSWLGIGAKSYTVKTRLMLLSCPAVYSSCRALPWIVELRTRIRLGRIPLGMFREDPDARAKSDRLKPRITSRVATLSAGRESCGDYFFGTCLTLAASFFFWFAASAFAFFCAACLLVAFGDLSPIHMTLRCTATGVNSEAKAGIDRRLHRYPNAR
jgi:hypothetical protein